jgi:transposase
VKTNRRDAVALAKLLRAGELTPVWVPDESHEAMRDLVRARAAAVETLRVHRQQVSAFMLKHSRISHARRPGVLAICAGCRNRHSAILPIRLLCRRC